jgi:hypothetical protein
VIYVYHFLFSLTKKETKKSRALDLLQQKAAWLKKGHFSLLFVYFFVRSDATHSKISLDQEKNSCFLISSAPIAASLLKSNDFA